MWKIQPQRRHQLGAGRAVRQESARCQDGRCYLRRHAGPQAAGFGVGHHDAGGSVGRGANRSPERERSQQRQRAHRPNPGEVTITRRLFRSGESEYLIDGKVARLRDIQDLFIGTGLGPESYAIIEQGRIGQILSNKPQDRRAIIEEAAGIGKFKTKKRLAEAKLEGAKQNLSRVFDILEEVGRQVNSLKRQASKAKRYEELKTEMIAQLRKSLTGRYRMLERDAAKTALDLNLANAEFQNLSTQVTEREREHTRLCRRLAIATTRSWPRRGSNLPICNWNRSARAAGWILRRSRSARWSSGWRRARRNRKSWRSGTRSCGRSWKRILQSVVELEAQIESARERLSAKAAEREQIQQASAGARQDARDRAAERSAVAGRIVGAEESVGADRRISSRPSIATRRAASGKNKPPEPIWSGTLR